MKLNKDVDWIHILLVILLAIMLYQLITIYIRDEDACENRVTGVKQCYTVCIKYQDHECHLTCDKL